MNDMQEHLLLHHLDDPLRILYWTVDEAAVMLLSPFVGMCLDQIILGFILSIFGTWGLTRLKKSFGGGTLKHALYWYLPPNKRLKHTPPSYIREYVA